MKPAQRVRSTGTASVPVEGATSAENTGAAGAPDTLAGLGQACYRCGLHLTEKHRPRAVRVWSLANRLVTVVMCGDCALTVAVVH